MNICKKRLKGRLFTKMSKLKDIFMLGRHKKMERFSASILIFSFLLILMSVLGFRQNNAKNNQIISEKALYTESFVASKTKTQGQVIGLYTNDTNTKAMILLKFGNINAMSADAKNYQVFLTAAEIAGNQQRIKSNPSGGVYIFGDTGYMGLYLVNNGGFDKQILQLTVRANVELARTENSTNYEDNTFNQFDQFTIYCNPAGSTAGKLASLNIEGAPDASVLYRDIISNVEIESAKAKARATLLDAEVALNKIDEFRDRVLKRNVEIPALPGIMVGDSIKSEKDKEGNVTIDYSFNENMKGALDFNWQENTIEDGFIEEAKMNYGGRSMSNKDFLVAQILDAKENKMPKLDADDWRLTDGRLIEDLNTGTSVNQEYKSINKACQDYINALEEYYDLKLRFQTQDLAEILQAENNLDSIEDLKSINLEKDTVVVY